MNLLRLYSLLSLTAFSLSALAQNPLTEIAGSTFREKTVYAVYDLPGNDLKVEAIESAALDAVRTYARNSQVRQGIPMTPFPEYPGQMTIGTRNSGGPKPDCAGEVFSIEGLDKSMAKYGEDLSPLLSVSLCRRLPPQLLCPLCQSAICSCC